MASTEALRSATTSFYSPDEALYMIPKTQNSFNFNWKKRISSTSLATIIKCFSWNEPAES